MRRGYLHLAMIFVFAVWARAAVAQTPAPQIFSGGILNSASLAADPTNIAAPGGLVTILGQNLAQGSPVVTSGSQLPTTVNVTAVLVGNAFAPLLYVSSTQINAQIPFETTPDTLVPVTVFVSGKPSNTVQLPVNATAPGMFTLSAAGAGTVVATHANGSLISEGSPAQTGEVIGIVATGLGTTLSSAGNPAAADGVPANNQPTVFSPTITIGGTAASVTSSVAEAGTVGAYLVKMVVPSVPSGDQTVIMTDNGQTTQAPVTMPVGQLTAVGGPVIFPGRILNAASLDPTNQKASPGGLITILGTSLATNTAVAGPPPLTRSLIGTTVTIGNIQAPLLLVSPGQINAQVPLELQPGSTVNVVVNMNGASSLPQSLVIATASPGIFTMSGNGTGVPFVSHAANGMQVTGASPALPGEQIQILVTGLGATLTTATQPPLVTGAAGAGQPTIVTPTVTIGTETAPVVSSVAAAGLVGSYYITAIVPSVPAGQETVSVSAAGNTSAAVSIPIGFLFAQPPAFIQANLAGNFTANFALSIPAPGDNAVQEIASFTQVVGNNGCTVQIAGTDGPTYTGLVHCQDYSDPNNLIAIIMALQDGQFANNKLVFTSLLDSGINEVFYIGSGNAPSGPVSVTFAAAITAGAVSIDMGRPNFAVGDSVVGTINITFTLPASGSVPGQSVGLGGGFRDTITSVQR